MNDRRLRIAIRTISSNSNGLRAGRDFRGFDDDDEDDNTTTVTTSTAYQDIDADEMPRAAWGVLFDAEERPTERLREVLAALGRWVVSFTFFSFFFFFLTWLLGVRLLGRRRVETVNVLTSRIA